MSHDPLAGLSPLRLGERRPAWVPATIWSGFCAAFVCVVIGAALQAALGTLDAMLAIVAGNWLLFLYAAAIGFACGRWGLSFSLVSAETFGRAGARLPALLLAVLVTGWFAQQLDLTAEVLRATLGAAPATRPIVCVALGLAFLLPLLAGPVHGLRLTAAALPAMLVFGALCGARHLWPLGLAALDGPLAFSDRFVDGMAVSFGTFVVSATMTGDIVRFCRTGSAAVGATAAAFLLSNLPFMLLGVVLAAAGVDLPAALAAGARHDAVGALLVALAVLSSWAACHACLVNAALGVRVVWRGLPWWAAIGVVGVPGIAMAIARPLPGLLDWALLLSTVVPPVGVAILVDYFLLRSGAGYAASRLSPVNVAALAAVAAGVGCALLARAWLPGWFFPLPGMMATLGVQLALGARPAGRAAVATASAGAAEAIDA